MTTIRGTVADDQAALGAQVYCRRVCPAWWLLLCDHAACCRTAESEGHGVSRCGNPTHWDHHLCAEHAGDCRRPKDAR